MRQSTYPSPDPSRLQSAMWLEAAVSSWPGPKPSLSHITPSPSPYLVDMMVADFNELWNKVRTVADEAESARTLAEILPSKDGPRPTSNLGPSEVVLCIEIIKSLEFAYHISLSVRPEEPANAEAIRIFDSLWKLLQKCWDDERTRRPRIQEVVGSVGDAAANWHIDIPSSDTEHRMPPLSMKTVG